MRHAVWTLGCLISMCSVGCGPKDAAPERRDITIQEVGSAQIWATSDTITDIRDIAFTNDGSAWVLNKKAPFLIKFDPNGKVQRAWGNQGGGPGEYQYPEGLVTANGGKEIWIRDAAKEAFFNLAGSTAEPPSIKVDRSTRLIPMGFYEDNPFWSVQSDSGILVARATSGKDLLVSYQAEIIELRPDGSTRPILSLAKLLGDPAKSYPGAEEFLPYPLWAVCPDRTISLYDPTANVIRRYDPTGTMTDSILLPPPQNIEINFDRAFQMFRSEFMREAPPELAKDTARFREEMKKEFEREANNIAKVFPEYFDMRCDRSNRLWIQPFDYAFGDLGRGPLWYQLAASAPPKGIKLPANFWAVEFAADRIWGVARDDNDVPSVAWVKVPESK